MTRLIWERKSQLMVAGLNGVNMAIAVGHVEVE